MGCSGGRFKSGIGKRIQIDIVIEDAVLKEIPIIKSFIALRKTGMVLRERNLLKQTIFFIQVRR
jgi:hypothetical protein